MRMPANRISKIADVKPGSAHEPQRGIRYPAEADRPSKAQPFFVALCCKNTPLMDASDRPHAKKSETENAIYTCAK